MHRRITYYTTLAAALATCEALEHIDEVGINRLQDLHASVLANQAAPAGPAAGAAATPAPARREVGT